MSASHLQPLHRLGESIDRLVTVEFRPQTGSVPAGLVAPLYAAARNFQGSPLSTAASQLLIERAAGKPVLVVTGAGTAPALPAGETDGPPGAVALAKALTLGLNCKPVLVTEANHAPAVDLSLATIGLCTSPIELFGLTSAPAPELDPSAKTHSEAEAERILDTHSPAAVIFVERDGRNPVGRYHGVRGNCRPVGSVAAADELALLAAKRNIVTLGIGDGGNEVGFGAFREEVADVFPDGGGCDNGCAPGRVTSISTDVCVAAGISNWGAYGVAAAIAATLQLPSLLLAPDDELALVEACLRGGALDGATSSASLSVDGVSHLGSKAILTLLHELIAMYLA